MNPTFSIIVPIHNAEASVEKCIEAVLAQSFSDFELLLINDGSTDGTDDICTRMAAKDSRISYFSRPWGGVSMARNYGLSHAKGDYLTFTDADDLLLPDALKTYWNTIQEYDADMIKAGYEKVRGGISDTITIPKVISIPDNDTEAMLYNTDTSEYRGYLWNSAIRREMVKDITFEEGLSWMEDHIFIWECMKRCRSMVLIPDVVYVYHAKKSGLLNTLMDSFLIVEASRKEYNMKRELLPKKKTYFGKRLENLFRLRLAAAVRKAYIRYDYPTRKQLCKEMSEIHEIRKKGTSGFFCSWLPFFLKDGILNVVFALRGDME